MSFSVSLLRFLIAVQICIPLAHAFESPHGAMRLFERSDAGLLCRPPDDHFNNADSTPFPCNKERATLSVCALPLAFDADSPTAEHLKEEQQCICDAEGRGNVFWRYSAGCQDCLRSHGGYYITDDDLDALASSYCGSSPTIQFATLSNSYYESLIRSQSATQTSVLGTSTDVSLYWTDVSTETGSGTTNAAKPTGDTVTSQVGNTGPTPTGSGAASTSTNAAPVLAVSKKLILAMAGLFLLL